MWYVWKDFALNPLCWNINLERLLSSRQENSPETTKSLNRSDRRKIRLAFLYLKKKKGGRCYKMYANVCFPTAKANGKSSRRSTSRSTRERRSCSLRKIRSCPLNWTRYVIRSCAAYTSRKQTSPSQLFYSITSLFNNPADWVLVQRQRQLLHAHAEIRIP